MQNSESDPFDLARFVHAQTMVYQQAIAELRAGRKRSHWMWFIFPQYAGLGQSPRSVRYAIKSVAEAEAYLRHALLGSRLRECMAVLNNAEGLTANAIFGSPDDLKLQSCATLFGQTSTETVFARLLEKYFDGQPDAETLRLLNP